MSNKPLIKSSGDVFVVFKSDGMKKFKKGANLTEIVKVMGEPFKIKISNNDKNKKLFFKLRDGNFKESYYEMLFLEDLLEWVIKTS